MDHPPSVQVAQSQMMTFAPHASIWTIGQASSAPACCLVVGVMTGLLNWMTTATALPVVATGVKNRLIYMAH
ncbi:hypothetical protein AM629_19395 [Photorhabdus heterorhabditis]|uniref:Uncharacterized protein n=1 Tax=Photorhabdus heterorhabditis TaxID=880156 RepID=A0ABR5K7Q4_9GAMM|nr:hypothetical protein AM629_19395 [Photorhabdus heterorhabditis]